MPIIGGRTRNAEVVNTMIDYMASYDVASNIWPALLGGAAAARRFPGSASFIAPPSPSQPSGGDCVLIVWRCRVTL